MDRQNGVTYWGRRESGPARTRTTAGQIALKIAAAAIAVLAGVWAALTEPTLGLFEQTMRTLGIVGTAVSVLWLLHTVVVVFLLMMSAMFAFSLVVGVATRTRRGSDQAVPRGHSR